MSKSVLVIVPYEKLYPPINGGMQRCFHIIHQLAKYFDLTIIINQDKQAFLSSAEYYPSIGNATVYSTKDVEQPKDIFSHLPVKIRNGCRYRWYKKKIRGSADSNFLNYYPVLTRLLKSKKFDVVILEKLATLDAVSVIRKYSKSVRIVYDAHNVDTNLALAQKSDYYPAILKAESSLYKSVDAILTCSQNDLQDFEKMNNHKLLGAVIPNGVHIEKKLFDDAVKLQHPEYILFCGSLGYEPNTQGLLWFYTEIWKNITAEYPALKLLVVGSGTAPENLKLLKEDSSIIFTGRVDDVKPYYNKATIAIVPIQTGSGTRLKVLEAMGLGVPVLSTSKGAEGINYVDGESIIIADDAKTFSSKLNYYLQDINKRVDIQQAAMKLVEDKYNWDNIGKSLALFLSKFDDSSIKN